MERALEGLVPTERADSLGEAVSAARRAAASGDVVLLSPACASFDMFDDFEDRGRQFKELVASLASKAATGGGK
jgi:UDP-N-acetylmuramoylalanine--D-glutamate ligase